jgi:hypothetical protein
MELFPTKILVLSRCRDPKTKAITGKGLYCGRDSVMGRCTGEVSLRNVFFFVDVSVTMASLVFKIDGVKCERLTSGLDFRNCRRAERQSLPGPI